MVETRSKGSSGKTGNIRKRARGKDKLTVNWITPLDSPLVFSSMTRKDTKEGKELLGRDIQPPVVKNQGKGMLEVP